MLSVSLVQLMSLFKGLQDKIGLWLMVALCILALLGSSAYFLVKSLIPPVPESIEIGQADAPSNRGKADYALMQALTARKEPVTWVFAGDSITHGCMHTDYLRNYQEHFTQALKATPERARDTVVNTGVSGATTRELMEYFNAWVADYQADVVFLCFGMNDCATDGITPESYAGNLREAVRRIRAAGAIPVLQTPNTSNRQRKLRPYLEAARALVQQEKILLIDHNAFWSSHPKEVKKLMADGIHPNEYGHLLWVRYLLQSLELCVSEEGIFVSGSYHDLSLPEDPDPARAEFSLDKAKSALFAPYFSPGQPFVWVYLGGGTTAGTRFSQNGARAYPEHIQEVSRWEMIGDEYTSRMRYAINQAHSGDTVSDMLLHYDDWVGRFHPSVVSIMPEFEGEKSGLNVQARFEHDLSALISRAKSDGALVILQMPLTLRKDLSGCLATMRNLGQQEGVILLDLTRLAQETAQNDARVQERWFDENGRPNEEGELVIARYFCTTLLDVPKNSRILTKHYSCV